MFAQFFSSRFLAQWHRPLALCLAALLLSALQPAHAARRALVIGNANYLELDGKRVDEDRKLPASKRDAEAVASTLRALGFEGRHVIEVNDLRTEAMNKAIYAFIQSVQKGDEVVFYFSGHGVGTETRGNYLMPIDGRPLTEGEPESRLDTLQIPLKRVLEDLNKKSPDLVLAIIDACSTYPMRKAGKNAGEAAPPLDTRQQGDKGQLVMYAAGPGETAWPFLRAGEDHLPSVYTRVLVEEMKKPSPSILNMALSVTSRVVALTESVNKKQTPVFLPNLKKNFTFVAPEAPRPVVLADTQAQTKVKELEAEVERLLKERGENKPSGLTNWDRNLGMVELPRGSYLRGSADEAGRDSDEGPVKEVHIRHRLLMGRTEVTRGQFAAFVSATKYRTQAERDGGCYIWTSKWELKKDENWQNPGFDQTDEHPVVCVSWNDAQAYIDWLNKQTGYGAKDQGRYRLPSEAEWEFAARGLTHPGQNRSGAQHWRYPWGDDKDYKQMCGYANGADQTAKKTFDNLTVSNCQDNYTYTAPVGRFTPNDFKLYDMIGNVWEWTQDCHASNYDAAPVDGRTHEPSTECRRVLRGGSWVDNPVNLRAANRDRSTAGNRDNNVGLRLARTLSP